MNHHAASQHIPLLRKGLAQAFGSSDACSSPVQLLWVQSGCCHHPLGAVLCAASSSFEAALGISC